MFTQPRPELFLWSVDAVICELEGSVTDRDARLGTENFVSSYGLIETICF
jgi:hypothetical protein